MGELTLQIFDELIEIVQQERDYAEKRMQRRETDSDKQATIKENIIEIVRSFSSILSKKAKIDIHEETSQQPQNNDNIVKQSQQNLIPFFSQQNQELVYKLSNLIEQSNENIAGKLFKMGMKIEEQSKEIISNIQNQEISLQQLKYDHLKNEEESRKVQNKRPKKTENYQKESENSKNEGENQDGQQQNGQEIDPNDQSKIAFTLENKHEDEGETHSFLIQCNNDAFVCGGQYNQIQRFSSDLKPFVPTDLKEQARDGVACNDNIIIYTENLENVEKQPFHLSLYNQDNLQLQDSINIADQVHKMVCVKNEYTILAENEGAFEIRQVKDNKFTEFKQVCRFNQDFKVNDIIKIQDIDSNTSEYAIATNNGLYFGVFSLTNETKFNQKIDETYFVDNGYSRSDVITVCPIGDSKLIAAVGTGQICQLYVVERDIRAVQICSNIGSSSIYSIQQIIGFKPIDNPYLIVKGRYRISIVNTRTMTEDNSYQECEYQKMLQGETLIQYEKESKRYLVTLANEHNSKKREILTIQY